MRLKKANREQRKQARHDKAWNCGCDAYQGGMDEKCPNCHTKLKSGRHKPIDSIQSYELEIDD